MAVQVAGDLIFLATSSHRLCIRIQSQSTGIDMSCVWFIWKTRIIYHQQISRVIISIMGYNFNLNPLSKNVEFYSFKQRLVQFGSGKLPSETRCWNYNPSIIWSGMFCQSRYPAMHLISFGIVIIYACFVCALPSQDNYFDYYGQPQQYDQQYDQQYNQPQTQDQYDQQKGQQRQGYTPPQQRQEETTNTHVC